MTPDFHRPACAFASWCAMIALSMVVVLPPTTRQLDAADWPMFGRDATRNAVSTEKYPSLACYDVTNDAKHKPIRNGKSISSPPPAANGLDRLHERIKRKGKNRSPDAIFVPTPQDVVDKMLEIANVKKSDLVYDLGSGDGRFVITAAKAYGCKAIGYEIDPELVRLSKKNVEEAKLGELARIEHEDIFTRDLSKATVITVFLYPRLLDCLLPQFKKLKPGARIVSHHFAIPGVKPDKVIYVESMEDGDKHRVYLWTVPLELVDRD